MGQALYRKYRSRSLDEIVGQSHITAMLKRAIEKGNVAHAYLLTGPRGVGKTSIARILAHEINGLPYTDESTHLDIIEIDAASNNSVEDVRDLREKATVAPATAAKKIYIIDEVHMLSKSAFNALLKTLEEPPEHVVFILATTDADKLPATIISRVQRFNFRLITAADAVRHLRSIANAEKIAIDDDALDLVARHGRGSFRDSISLLDQLRSLTEGTITPALIESVLGLADTETVHQLLEAYEQQDLATIVRLIDAAEERGTTATILADQLITAIRSDIIAKPQLLTLLDALLEINKSAWPHVKLLTALAPLNMQPRTAPITYPVSKPAEATPVPRAEESAKKQRAKSTSPLPAEPPAAPSDEESPLTPDEQPAPTYDTSQPFPWTDFLSHIKESSAGAHSLLTKCGYEFDGIKLTIYATRTFNKNKIEKSMPQLSAALEHVGVANGTITVLATAAPPKDSQTAAILDMMGGGEEVSL